MEKTIGVIGIGNPFRHDDAIGIILLDFLREHKQEFLSGISLIDCGTGGMNVLHLMSDFDTVLIIDAVKLGKPSGSWSFFSYNDVRTRKHQEPLSTHVSDIFQVIQLSKKIHKKPETIFFFGIEPADLSIGQGLSESVKNNLFIFQEKVKEKLHWMIDSFQQ